jgi:cytochrome c553
MHSFKTLSMMSTPNRIAVAAFAMAALSLAAVPGQAADRAAGQAKADAVCAACHGKDGNTPIDPSYPKLAGQHPDFLVRALTDYKTGSRKNAVMAGQAQALSKADIDNLADYYASLPGSLSTRR